MTNPNMTISKRETELAAYLERQPYQVEQDGIHLTIAKNVFPSDFGLTSKFFGQYMLQQPPSDYGLDMGCGSGYFAFLLKKIGCKQVIGVDFNPDAVNCAEENRTLNPHLTPIEFVHSDLFASVPPQKFGIIVFNFNYYPSNGNFGLNADGGREILQRFFSQVDDYLDTDARIYIPYSEFVGDEHDPAKIAEDFGFKVTVVAETENHAGRHFKYLLVKS